LAKLREYLIGEKIIISVSLETLRQILRCSKIRLRRTKTWKECNDPHLRSKKKRIRKYVRNPAVDGPTVAFDEFGPLGRFVLRPVSAGVANQFACERRTQDLTAFGTGWRFTMFTRRERRPALGIYPQPKTTPGNAWGLETSSQKVSSLAANPSDIGQLFAASQGCCEAVLPEEQCAFDLDADECIMAQSNRMSVYAGERICLSQLRLRKPQTAEHCFGALCALQKQESSKVIVPFWKRH
jgi:hypothetical protein